MYASDKVCYYIHHVFLMLNLILLPVKALHYTALCDWECMCLRRNSPVVWSRHSNRRSCARTVLASPIVAQLNKPYEKLDERSHVERKFQILVPGRQEKGIHEWDSVSWQLGRDFSRAQIATRPLYCKVRTEKSIPGLSRWKVNAVRYLHMLRLQGDGHQEYGMSAPYCDPACHA
jgi:hypothetical protein